MRKYTNTKLHYNGKITFVFENTSYCASVRAEANYYYQPCVMYFKDGSGQPEDEEFEINSLEIESLIDEELGVDLITRFNTDEEFKSKFEDEIYDVLYEMDWEKWESDTPEPDYDDFD